jgi:hypothetical protein
VISQKSIHQKNMEKNCQNHSKNVVELILPHSKINHKTTKKNATEAPSLN